MSPAETVAEMRRRYGGAGSYEDTGELVETITRQGDSDPTESRVTFSTAFQRSTGSFRFEYAKTYPRIPHREHAVVWRRGSAMAHVWWTTRPRVVELPLADALASLTGVSSGTAAVVTHMLLGIDRSSPSSAYSFAGEEIVRGVPCELVSSSRAVWQTTMWIGRDDHALHRFGRRTRLSGHRTDAEMAKLIERVPDDQRARFVEAMREIGDVTSDATIDLTPTFDQPIADGRFDFTAPP